MFLRSLVLGELGDSVDLVMRRANSVDGAYDGEPLPINPGQGLGKLYWQAWGEHCHGGFNWTAGCGGYGRVATIDATAVGEQTATSRAGDLHLYTTPMGNPGNPLKRVTVGSEGQVILYASGTVAAPLISFGGSRAGLYPDSQNGTAFVIRAPNNGAQFGGAITWPASTGHTSYVLVIRKPNDVFETRTVEVGDPNSCGSGRRCLYVDN